MAVSLPPTRTDALQLVYDGLRMQQHRGQDGSGMAYSYHGATAVFKKVGLVAEVFDRDWLSQEASQAIGHNRYATQGEPSPVNLQPQASRSKRGMVFVVSNGDLTNYRPLRRDLEAQGVDFVSDNDAEAMAHIMTQYLERYDDPVGAIAEVQARCIGAFSAAALINGRIYIFRDRFGFRPLALCQLPDGGIAAASETVAFDALGADPLTYRDVAAGAIIELTEGRETIHRAGHAATHPCVFEYVYFARPDSLVYGLPVSLIRRRIGWQLGLSWPGTRGNLAVVPVPDSATEIGRGVAEAIGVPVIGGLLRSHTARRTFIESDQAFRDEGVKYKFNPDRFLIEGQRVILVDDSIVRGTTIHKIVRMIRRAGAAEVHLVIGSPPMRWPCFMGVATPTKKELIANNLSIDKIQQHAEADSLQYLSLKQLKAAVGPLQSWEREKFPEYLQPILNAPDDSLRGVIHDRLKRSRPERHCFACFTGQYPLPTPDSFNQ